MGTGGELAEPLFSTKTVLAKKKENTSVIKPAYVFSEEQLTHEFYISEHYRTFAQQLPKLEPSGSYHFVSIGQWSLKHVVFHIAALIGKCDVYATTYGLGPGAARGIVTALDKGLFSSFHFLYDNKIKTYKEEAHNICNSNFAVKICSIHAKVTVLENENWSIVVSGSANWSDSNDKIELTNVFCSKKAASFHKSWILEVMKSEFTEPKKIYNELFK